MYSKIFRAYINLVGESEFCDMHTLMIAKESLGHINRQLGKLKIAKVYYKEVCCLKGDEV